MFPFVDAIARRFGYERPEAEARVSEEGESRDLAVDNLLIQLSRGAGGLGGIPVTPKSALGLTAVYAAIERLATDTAAIPIRVYRKRPDGGRDAITDHPVCELLCGSPDGETTSMRFRQALMGQTLGWGNGYAEISIRNDGRPGKLYLLDSAKVTPKRTPSTKALFYDLGDGRSLFPSRTIHIAGFGFDGLVGYSRITLARQAVELGLELQQYGAAFFANGSRPGGVLETPNTLDPDARKNLRESFEAFHRGSSNAGRVALLEQGLSYKPISIPPEDAQFIQGREFQVIEIARLFGLPPSKIGDFSESHRANLEESNLDYMQTCLMPWLEQIEAEFNRKLFTEEERRAGFYVEHCMQGFLRGAPSARSAFYATLFNLGVFSANEIRAFENLNPIEGGDKHLVQMNMTTITNAGEPQPKAA